MRGVSALAPLIRAVLGLVLGFVLGAGVVAIARSSLGLEAVSELTLAVGYTVGLIGWLIGLGALNYWFRYWLGLPERESGGHSSAQSAPQGWARYFRFTTDHKVIGVQYLVIMFVFILLAGLLAMLIRAELMAPGQTFLDRNMYNTVMSLHGIIMIAVAVVAIIAGLGNFLVPLMIGAQDMAFPRLNALTFWLVPPAALILLSSVLVGGFDSGWTAYPPLSVTNASGQLFFILAVVTIGISSILGAINFLVTIFRMRAPGMTMSRLPIFVWSILCAAILAATVTQFLAGALIMVMLDRVLSTSFFDSSKGADPVLFQHLFWFYSHPAVYIMIIPAFGIVLEILPVFARKPLFAYKVAVGGLLTIVGLSYVVWAHHMFTSGMPEVLHGPFMISTELISVPTGLIFLSALGTLWLGRLWLVTPMLFAMGFIFTFLIGGITGIFNADVPTDVHLHDTYFVVAHFHYTIMGGMLFGLFAGVYHWFPKITGRMLNEGLSKAHFWLTYVGFNATFMPMFWLGINGMNRRIADYPPQFAGVNLFVSLSAFLMGGAMLLFLYNLVYSWAKGRRAEANPWQALTLEWQVSSPPPVENFEEIPRVASGPYDYGVPRARTTPRMAD